MQDQSRGGPNQAAKCKDPPSHRESERKVKAMQREWLTSLLTLAYFMRSGPSSSMTFSLRFSVASTANSNSAHERQEVRSGKATGKPKQQPTQQQCALRNC